MPKSGCGDHYATEFVQAHVDDALAEIASYTRGMMDACIVRQPLESPLETAFYVWWTAWEVIGANDFILIPQAEVDIKGEKFRLDFAVAESRVYEAGEDLLALRIAIELDGHEFHERTREQVERRNYRDRRLLEHGWKVLHYSGSEFHREPSRCVRDAYLAAVGAKYAR